MVNAQADRRANFGHKAAILQQLRAAEGTLSGNAMGEALGLSRVAVWKHLEGLRAAGYGIVSDASGYRLEGEGDFLYPWEFPGRADAFEHYEETDSTMDRGLASGLAGAPGGRVVVAERQSAGRGRRGRAWKSEEGGLFFSLLLRPTYPAREVQRAVLSGSAALCLALRALTGQPFSVEWPNDLYLGRKKAAGLLPEYLGRGESLGFLVLGVGLNVRNRAPHGAVSLAEICRTVPTRRSILSAFLDELEGMPADAGALAELWTSLSTTPGREVRAEGAGEGRCRAAGIDGMGRLLVDCVGAIPGAERDAETGLQRLWPGEAVVDKKGVTS